MKLSYHIKQWSIEKSNLRILTIIRIKHLDNSSDKSLAAKSNKMYIEEKHVTYICIYVYIWEKNETIYIEYNINIINIINVNLTAVRTYFNIEKEKNYEAIPPFTWLFLDEVIRRIFLSISTLIFNRTNTKKKRDNNLFSYSFLVKRYQIGYL